VRSSAPATSRRAPLSDLERELAELEGSGAKESEIRARQRAVERRGDIGARPRRAGRRHGEEGIRRARNLHARKIIEDELVWRELKSRYSAYFEGGMGARRSPS